jgi:exosortase A-associated hydrolase 2
MDDVPLTLWGLRSGCLLAAALASQWPLPCHFLLWQPATHGETVVRQWLRQGAAAALLEGRGPGSTTALQAELAADRCIEIGGYRIHPALIEALSSVSLHPPARRGSAVWLEVRNGALPSPHASEAWAGPAPLTAEAVPGPAFWQTSEIALAPALIERSLALLEMYTPPAKSTAETP